MPPNPPHLLPPAEPLLPLAIQVWDGLPEGRISIDLTKAHVQELYFAIRDLMDSQANLQQALIHYSNANLGFANDHLRKSQQFLIDSQQRLNTAMSEIMLSARRASP